jgi:predicted ester cyclase
MASTQFTRTREEHPIMSAQENKDTVIRLYEEVLCARNYALADKLLAVGYVFHPSVPGKKGHEAYTRTMQRGIHSVFSDIEAELHSVVAEGDEVAVYETLTMTHVGTLMGIEPTGRRVSGRTMTFYRFEEEGKIAESWGMEELEVIAAKLES